MRRPPAEDVMRDLVREESGSMMCEKHPGQEWGRCEGGPDCVGPGMPWTVSGHIAIRALLETQRKRDVQKCRDIADEYFEDGFYGESDGASACAEAIEKGGA